MRYRSSHRIMVPTTPRTLILPGLGGSGAAHWQTLWQARSPDYQRVEQRDWDRPQLDEWLAALDRALEAEARPAILVAHSLACALVAHRARRGAGAIRGALLVAPADVDTPERTPPETRSFAPMPLQPLPFPALVVASQND